MKKNYIQSLIFSNKNRVLQLGILFFFLVITTFSTKAQTFEDTTPNGIETFTVPCGVTSITVECLGAGGAGGGDSANSSSGGGGGAGGSYASSTFAVTAGQIFSYSVGNRATGGTGNGGNGQPTWFLNTSTLYAQGGQGGIRCNGTKAGGVGSIAATIGTIKIAGGDGEDGTTTYGGAGGDAANTTGTGAARRASSGGNGNATTNSGAGGGGAYVNNNNNRNGGNSGYGKIVITANIPLYCSPTFTSAVEPITNVTFAGINNTTSNTVNGTPPLQEFCIAGSVMQGAPTNPISLQGNSDGNFDNYYRVYIDWNQNGVLGDGGNETYDIGIITDSNGNDGKILTGNISVPVSASIGRTKMRVMKRYAGYSSDPCQTGAGFGQVEDYFVDVVAPPPCVAPTLQPTILNLTATANTMDGSFTAPIPAPDSYLVIRNTTGIAPPAPVDGTTYAIGSTLGAGNIVVDTDGNTVFTATGLTNLTTYYFFIYSFNSICTGGPLYNSVLPLTGSKNTLNVNYCAVSTTNNPATVYINEVSFVGTLNDAFNLNSSYSTTTPGYQDFTGLPNRAIQAQGEGVNIIAGSNNRGRWKVWVDWNKDGDFNDGGELVYNVGSAAGITLDAGFIIPVTAAAGDYRVRVRVYNSYATWSIFTLENYTLNYSPCETFDTISINFGAPFGTLTANEFGEAEDYYITVVPKCDNIIASITPGEICGPGTVDLSVTGSAGVTSFKWYAAETGGLPIATTLTGDWTTPSISSTTTYYVTAVNGCESLIRTPIVAKISPLPTLSFTPTNPIICGENAIVALTAAGDTELVYLIDEDFEAGGLGVFINVNNDTNNATFDNLTRWRNRSSTLIPTGPVWRPAISSGFGTNKFALTSSDLSPSAPGDIENSLTLNAGLNTTSFLDLTLTMKFYYSRYLPDNNTDYTEYVVIESSTNNFTTSSTIANYVVDQGIGTRFAELTFDLSSLINQTNVKIRIRHRVYSTSTGWLPNGAAVDDVKIFGTKPLTTSFVYDTSTVDAFSDAGCTVAYSSGSPASTIYIRPTITQLENSNFIIPVSTTLTNGCSVAGNIMVVNNSKIYNNSGNSDWNNPANWKPAGVPTANSCVIIYNDTDITGTNYQAYARNLRVESTGNLNLGSSNFLTVTENVSVVTGGVFDIENNGSLVQIDDVINSGSITYKRDAIGIKGGDYVYWSSPVLNQPLNTIYSSPTSGPKYKWNTLTNNGNGNFGNISQGTWEGASGNTMEVGKGYIVRGSSSSSAAATTINSVFYGVPNNGTIPVTVNRGQYTGAPYAGANGTLITNLDDNWNLVGNPYPSAINALQFLADNSSQILGNVRLWTHGSDIAQTNGTTVTNPFYGSFGYNYSSSDYAFINYTGSTIPTASDFIKTGQAFFVQMVDGAGNASGTINFNNGQRRNTYANDNFYRTTSENQTNEEESESLIPERHRLWLDIVNSNNKSITTLIGYASGATNEKDSKFDANEKHSGSLGIYSMIDNETFAIQGRSLPFNQHDEISIAFNVDSAGSYHIAILTLDGLFEHQAIYLKDEFLNIYHDLKIAPYHFISEGGFFSNRFKIVYQYETLDIPEFSNNNVVVYKDKFKAIQISTGNYTMDNVKIHDISGRLLLEKKEVNSNLLTIENLKDIADQVLLVIITTTENKVITKKVF